MRWLLTLALLAVTAWPAAAGENEAEKLFRGMEEKVRTAKTLQLRFDASITEAGDKKVIVNVKGTLILGEGDKLRAEGEGKLLREEVKFTDVSDGTDMKSYVYLTLPSAPKREAEIERSPKGVGAYLRGALHREGFFVGVFNMSGRSDVPDDLYKSSDFKLAGKEKIGERNTQVVQYAITVKKKGTDKDPNVLSMKVWLDAKTNLPVQLTMTGGSDPADVTETYSEFTIDAKVDAKSFELPKDDAKKLAAAERSSLAGHTATVNALAFSPDGKALASAGDDQTVRVWDVASGKERAALSAPSGKVNALTFSADGKTLAWVTNGGTATLWDLAAGKERVSFEVNKDRAFTVALAPDGKTLATAGETTGEGGKDLPTEVKLWDAGTGKGRASLKGHLLRVNAVAFSPDGKALASGSNDQTIRLWDMATGKEAAVLKGHEGVVWSLAFTPDGKTLVSGGWDGTVRVWDVAKGKERLTLKGQEGLWVMAVASTGNGKTLASGSLDAARGKPGRVILWDAGTGQTWLSIEGGWGPVAVSPDGKVLASVGGAEKKPVVKLWDVTEAPKEQTDR